VLLHLIDLASSDPINDFQTINEELTSYGHGLISRPRIFVLNKKELLNENDIKKLLNTIEQLTEKKVYVISAVTRFGLDDLLSSIWNELGY
jgi:GTP-binding protein